MKNSRISTGINSLDEIINSGFIPSSGYLIVGAKFSHLRGLLTGTPTEKSRNSNLQ